MSIHKKIRAGDSLLFTEELKNYPASLYTLTYTLINAYHKYTINTSNNNDTFVVSLTPSQTENFEMGTYAYVAHIEKDNIKLQVLEGNITILPNLESLQNLDTRTFAQQMVDTINAVIGNTATLEQKQYTINGRTMVSRDLPELLEMRQLFLMETAREENSKGIKNNRHSLYTVFRRH